jgi:UDP:flavonoid glycosyltransferase YjiC (YdhE family)
LATILLGWELGGGLGHVHQSLAVARALAAHGHRPVLALKNLVEPWPVLQGTPFPVLQAPFWHPRPVAAERNFLAASYADILAIRGFADADDLAALVQGWQALVDLVQPQLAIADHCPTLCLAVYKTLPVVMFGNGFTVPPVELATFPPLVPGAAPVVPQEQLLAVAQEVQRRRRRPVPATFPGIFAAAERCLTVFPELDPYQSVRRDSYLGPLEPQPKPVPPPSQPRFFAYLTAEAPYLEEVLVGLARTGVPGAAYVRGASPALKQRLRHAGLEVPDRPAALDELLPRVSAIVHHGGVGVAQQALAAGRPQLLLPQHLEHSLTAQKLAALGVGGYLSGTVAAEGVVRALRQLLAEPRYAERALACAQSLQARGPWTPLEHVVKRCLALLK